MPADLVPLSTALLGRLTSLGVSVDEVLARAGLDRSRFELGKARLTTREFFAFWDAVDASAGAPRELGLLLGSQSLEHKYSVASVAALHASGFEEGVRTMARYKRITCPEHVEVVVTRGEVSIRCQWILAETDVPRLLVDSAFATFLELARRGTGTHVVPRRVELARRRADVPLLTKHFGCEITFGAPFDRLVFDERTMALPFVTRDAHALAALTPDLERALAGRPASRPFRDEVRVAIARQMSVGRPTVDKVARRLRVSPRTLQRRLEEEETTYQLELDDVRRKTARRLLSNTDLDAVEVAFFLGFEEPNSFARAFRGWEGTTPSRWRAHA